MHRIYIKITHLKYNSQLLQAQNLSLESTIKAKKSFRRKTSLEIHLQLMDQFYKTTDNLVKQLVMQDIQCKLQELLILKQATE